MIFSLALAVRLLYLYESADNPTFSAPLVDSLKYDLMARGLAEGKGLDEAFFLQSCFYPFFLSAVYSVSGSSMVFARILQLTLGAFTCVLVYQLGEQLFNRRIGLLAGVMAALYAPLFFYEGELLGTGWSAFWAVALLRLVLIADKKLWLFFVLGICGALSTLTRPSFLVLFLGGSAWVMWPLLRSQAPRRMKTLAFFSLLAGFIPVAGAAATLNLYTTGHFRFLPAYGGLNFYIGNHPNTCALQRIRPGPQWERLKRLPEQHGHRDIWDGQQYFYRETVRTVREKPTTFLEGLAVKTAEFMTPREIPNSVKIYIFRRWSLLLRLLVWKVGRFGFPFGLLLPLTVWGLFQYRKRLPAVFFFFLILYPLSVIAVHVCSRYRIPIIPVMIPAAAAGLASLGESFKRRCWHRSATALGVMIAAGALCSLPGPFCREELDFEAELEYYLGYHAQAAGDLDLALKHYNAALRLNPEEIKTYSGLGTVLMEKGRLDEAVEFLRRAVALEPDYAEAHKDLGDALTRQGHVEEGVKHFRQALRIDPDRVEPRHKLALALLQAGDLDGAAAHLREALRRDPSNWMFLTDLGSVLAKAGRWDEATTYYAEALRINPDSGNARYNLAVALMQCGNLAEALEQFQQASRLNPDDPEIHYRMGETFLALGNREEAAACYREALRLRPEWIQAEEQLAALLHDAEE